MSFNCKDISFYQKDTPLNSKETASSYKYMSFDYNKVSSFTPKGISSTNKNTTRETCSPRPAVLQLT